MFNRAIPEALYHSHVRHTTDSPVAPRSGPLAIREQRQRFLRVSDNGETGDESAGASTTGAVFGYDKRLVMELKKCVVNIEQNISIGLNSEKTGKFNGTGFIVDAERGIIATNYHVTGTSPQQVKITFENGESTDALVLHYDVWNDFAFYKVDPSALDFELVQAELGESFGLEEHAEVLLIGNNEGFEYSVKYGRVTNLCMNRGKRHSLCMQTSFDRTKGSSGSPVFDRNGRVVGIHTSGTDTTSFELRVEYLVDALEQLRKHQKVQRGDIGVELDLVRVSDAVNHFRLPQEAVDRMRAQRAELKYVAAVDRTLPCASALKLLKPGDIIWQVDGQMVLDNVYLFDKLIDSKVGSSVDVTVFRHGEILHCTVPVMDAELGKLRTFALFAGGVFHDITPFLIHKFEIHGSGTFVSQVEKGSCLFQIGEGVAENPTSYASLLEELNGSETPNLDAFISAVRKLPADHRQVYVLSRNLRSYRSSTQAVALTLDLKFHPLRVFQWSDKELNWIERTT